MFKNDLRCSWFEMHNKMKRTYEAPQYTNPQTGIKYVKVSELTPNDLKKIQAKVAENEMIKKMGLLKV